MKRLIVSFIVLFTLIFSYTILAQEMGTFRRNIKKEIPVKLMKPTGTPLATGTYTIGSGGDFPTIDSAFNKLSVDGIAGEVTLFLIDTLYIAPTTEYGFLLNGPIPGADQNNRVKITPDPAHYVTIEGDGGAVLSFINTSYLTLGTGWGIILLEIHALHNAQFTRNDCVVFLDNSDHNIIQLVDFISEDYTRDCAGIIFQVSSTSTPFSPDSNMMAGNRFKKAGIGIYLEGYANAATGNVIRVNSFGWFPNAGMNWGIHLFHNQNAIIENNTIKNLNHNSNSSLFDIIHGINAYWSDGTIIRNNLVHNVNDNSSYYGAAGILLSGSVGEFGNNNLVYNNMVYDIRNSSGQLTSCAAGINIWNQNNSKIYYNSIYLNSTESSPSRSAAFNVAGQCSNIDARNNIFVNTRDESPYCASAIYDYSIANILTSDYNDLYYQPNSNNCLVKIANTNYNTLADWQVTGKDLNSITEMPNFLSGPWENWVLNIDASIPTNLEKGATPIVGINYDYDGDLRNVSNPDIGADEFDGIVVSVKDEKVLPTEFTLGQNYPNPFNPITTINYQIPHRSNVSLKIYDIIGNEVADLVNEEQEVGFYNIDFNAARHSSGVYFYRLQARDFVQTRKMILLK